MDHPTPSRRRARVRALRALLVIASAQLWLPAVAASPAAAAAASLSVSMAPTSTSVLSGNDMSWRISWQCASVTENCTGARLEVPIPASDVDAITPVSASGTSSTGGFAPAATVSGNVVRWTFVDPLPAGSSGQVTLVLKSRNYVTPDGSTYTPTATMTATNADPVSVTAASIEIDTAAQPRVTKTRRGGATAPEPTLPADVTYGITARNDVYAGLEAPGMWNVQDTVISDPLPAGSVFVSASGGGTYDPATHTVTWTPTNAEMNSFAGFRAQVIVHYPSPPFIGDDNRATTVDEVTNTAYLETQGWLRPDDPPMTANDPETHGFKPASGGAPGLGITKRGRYEIGGGSMNVRGGDDAVEVDLVNTGTVTVGYRVVDHLPCTFTPGDGTPCADVPYLLRNVYLDGNGAVPSSPVTVDWVTTAGTTGQTVVVVPTLPYTTSLNLPAGEYLSSYTIGGSVVPDEHLVVRFSGITNGNLPTTEPAGVSYVRPPLGPSPDYVRVENCLATQQLIYQGTTTDMPLDPSRDCGHTIVRVGAPAFQQYKTITPQTVAPNEEATVALQIYNQGLPRGPESDAEPIVADLLPADMTYVPGSATATVAADPASNPVVPADMQVEAIDDYQGTGRTLLRFSWPDGQVLHGGVAGTGGGGASLNVRFRVRIGSTHAVGPATNTYSVLADNYTNGPPNRACFISVPVADSLDFDGDGNTTELRCDASGNYTVVAGGGVSVAKSVRGSLDTDFQAPPAVGLTDLAASSTFKVVISNSGNIDIDDVVAYDLLPNIGDVGSGAASGFPRGSEWRPTLAGGIDVPSGVTVSYSTAAVPCRGDAINAGAARASAPAGCTDDWSTTPPTDLDDVTALRFDFGAMVLEPADAHEITFDVDAASSAHGIAWNSVGVAASIVATGEPLQPTESPRVGLSLPVDVELDKSIDTPGPYQPGQEVDYRIDVVNRGPNPATGVFVDDVLPTGTTYVSSTATKGGYDSASGRWLVGDLGDDETASLTIRVRLPYAGGTITNRAEVGGLDQSDVDSTGGNCDLADPPAEDDCDEVSLDVDPPAPGIEIVKATNGHDANAAPGPYLRPGDVVTWTYEVVNTGNVDLTDVTVTDDRVAASEIDCGNGTNVVATLAVDETVTCSATGVAAAGQYANVGSVTGDDPVGDPVTDDDPSHYFGSSPRIIIIKSTNGADANNAPGPLVAVGDPVTWTYEVVNSGNVELTDVTVTDDRVSSSDIDCGEGTNVIAVFPIGESVMCTARGVAVAGQYANTGSVTGDDPTGAPVTDDDPSHYFGAEPAVVIVKSTNGEDANAAPGPMVPAGADVMWTYEVVNTGNVDLTDVTVTDDRVAASEIDCGNGTNVVATLAVDETVTCTATGVAAAGQYANTGTVTGDDPTGVEVSDDDPSHYYGSSPAIELDKQVCTETDLAACDPSDDSDWTSEVQRQLADEVAFRIVVRNVGPDDLTAVVVTDPLPAGLTFVSGSAAPTRGEVDHFPDTWTIGDLAPGQDESLVFQTTIGQTGRIPNVASVVGHGPAGEVLEASDEAAVSAADTTTTLPPTTVPPTTVPPTTLPPTTSRPPTTVPSTAQPPTSTTEQPSTGRGEHVDRGTLARTGAEPGVRLAIAGALIAAGVALVGVARARRRRAMT